MLANLPWIAAAIAAVLVAGLALWISSRRGKRLPPLPTEWTLSARPVFSASERRIYKLVRDALPQHVILSKLPLVRFCQPGDPGSVRYWYDLLGSIHVTFAICSANGRVLAAIDLDTERGGSRRTLQIKQSVLGACRVRYLRCSPDNLPTAGELQLLVPSGTANLRSTAAPLSDLDEARDSLASTVANRRAQRTALWQDSSLFQDSFFAPDSRQDSEFGLPPALAAAAAARTGIHSGHGELEGPDGSDGDSGGGAVVDDSPAPSSRVRT